VSVIAHAYTEGATAPLLFHAQGTLYGGRREENVLLRTKNKETRTIEEVVAEALGISREPNATSCVVTLP
jgi:hypothetical protein